MLKGRVPIIDLSFKLLVVFLRFFPERGRFEI